MKKTNSRILLVLGEVHLEIYFIDTFSLERWYKKDIQKESGIILFAFTSRLRHGLQEGRIVGRLGLLCPVLFL